VATRRGIPYEKRNQIYSLLKQRAEVLRRIQEQKITGFFELYAVLSKAYREGYLDKSMERVFTLKGQEI
jgi:hypothetical protein